MTHSIQRQTTLRTRSLLAMSAAALLLAIPPISHAISINLQPSAQTVALGSLVEFEVAISGLVDGTAPSLGAFDFDVNFDPVILSFDSIVFGDPVLGNQLGPLFGSITGFTSDPLTGLVNQFEISLDLPEDLHDLQADSFILTTLTFSTTATGIGVLSLTDVVLGDAFGDPIEADVIGDGTVTVIASVPENAPGIVSVLTLAGLCMAHAQSRHRRRVA